MQIDNIENDVLDLHQKYDNLNHQIRALHNSVEDTDKQVREFSQKYAEAKLIAAKTRWKTAAIVSWVILGGIFLMFLALAATI